MNIYLLKNNASTGPYSEADVREGLSSGAFTLDDMAWQEGDANWLPLRAKIALDTPPPMNYATLPSCNEPDLSPPVKYAGFWIRFLGYVLDWLILLVPTICVQYVVVLISLGGNLEYNTHSSSRLMAAQVASNLVLIGMNWLYFAVLQSSPLQATIGQLIFSLKVTDLEGRRISFWRAFLRFFGMIISFLILGVGFVLIAFSPKKRGLHDSIAGTVVVKRR